MFEGIGIMPRLSYWIGDDQQFSFQGVDALVIETSTLVLAREVCCTLRAPVPGWDQGSGNDQ